MFDKYSIYRIKNSNCYLKQTYQYNLEEQNKYDECNSIWKKTFFPN